MAYYPIVLLENLHADNISPLRLVPQKCLAFETIATHALPEELS